MNRPETTEDSVYYLVYSSRATRRFNDDDLHALNDKASAHNSNHGITGMLLYNNSCFLQYIEGCQRDIDALFWQRIVASPLHYSCRIQCLGMVSQRIFPQWSMQLVSAEQAIVDTHVRNDLLNAIQHDSTRYDYIASLLHLMLQSLSDNHNLVFSDLPDDQSAGTASLSP